MGIKYNQDIIIISISFLLFSIFTLFVPFNYLINFAHDDSFFYLKIAQNIVNGYGITFDNICSTNGFHPLYLIILTILFYILNLVGIVSSEQQFLAVFIFHIAIVHLIIGVSVILLRQFLDKEYNRVGLSTFLFICLSFVFIRDFGLESHLSCLLIVLYLLNRNNKSKKKRFYTAIIISGLFLSRTDYLLTLIPFLLIPDIYENKEQNRYYDTIPALLSLLFVVATYYLANIVIWGHAQTISGSIVNSFPSNVFFQNIINILSTRSMLFNQGLKLLLFTFISFLFYFKKNKNSFERTIMVVSFGLLLNCLLHLAYNNHGIREWYMTLPSFMMGFMLILWVRKSANFFRQTALVFFVILFIGVIYISRIKSAKWDYAIEYARELETITQKQDLIYQYDMSGILSYFSNRNLIDGDGLVNDFNYLTYLNQKNVSPYLKNKGVKYLSVINFSNDLFDNKGNYKLRGEDSLFADIGLSLNSLYSKYPLLYKHATGERYGYFLLFRLDN